MQLSVIICTQNRCKQLKVVLDSFFAQEELDTIDFELLVIDNDSSDDTKSTVLSYENKVQYYFEPQRGLSIARNTGIKNARGNICVFTDDDVTIRKGWLKAFSNAFKNTSIDAAGGRVFPAYPDNAPAWITNNQALLAGPIVSHDCGDTTFTYKQGMVPLIGANMAFRKSILLENMFDVHFGAGTGLMGEDTALFIELLLAGKRIDYIPEAALEHPVEIERMTLKYVSSWFRSSGKYHAELDIREGEFDDCKWIFGVPRPVWRILLSCFLHVILPPYSKSAKLKAWSKLCFEYGRVLQLRSNNKNNKSS